MADARHMWSLGGLPLVTHARPNGGFWFETLADGFDLGSPEAAVAVLKSLLLDGDDVRLDRWGNRTITFTVKACAYDTQDLALAERALSLQVGSPNILTWVPPDGVGATTLYDVRVSSMRMLVNDLEWVKQGVKMFTYAVTLTCAPWAYSSEVVTETFARSAGTVTIDDTCTAATAWVGMTAGTYLGQSVVSTPETSGGIITIGRNTNTVASTYTFIDVALENGAPIYSAVRGYSAGATVQENYASKSQPVALGSVQPADNALAIIPDANGFTRIFFNGRSVAAPFTCTIFTGGTTTAHVDSQGRSTTIPGGSQLALTTKGSVRVPAKMHVAGNTTLGEVFVYADPAMLQFGYNPGLATTWQYAPDGEYVFYFQPSGSYVATDVFEMTIGAQTARTRVGVAGSDEWFPVGPFHLGGNYTRRLGTVPATYTFTKNGASHTPAVRMFREDVDTALLHVTGISVSHLFIEPPSLEHLRPGVFAGAASDGSNAVSVLSTCKSWGWPTVIPPTTILYVTASGDANPTATVEHRLAFHTVAAA